MYAVIESGGKQYRVGLGQRVRLESLAVAEGDSIDFDKVLAVSSDKGLAIGTPHLDTTVSATVLGHGRGDKVRIIKFRRRQNSRSTQGHRQNYTEVQITAIDGSAYTPPVARQRPIDDNTSDAADTETESVATPDAAEPVDDLTAINGIGPVIAEKLAALGISRFSQIAELTPEDTARINDELSFKGRIEREEWIEQAQKIVAESSGS